MKLLVFGGRDYQFRETVFSVLDGYLSTYGDDLIIIHGGCSTGADRFTDQWAHDREVDCLRVPAKWIRHGSPQAGPIRNRRMAKAYRPGEAVSFPGGRGTRNMRSVCDEFDVEVREIT